MSVEARSTDGNQLRCDRCARIAIYLGITEALIFLVLKVVLGLASGSWALVAASLYSMQDLMSSLVAAAGIRISAKQPDESHPYGHGKVEYLVVGVMSLMILLGLVALAVTSLASLFGEVRATEAPSMLAFWVAATCAVSCWLVSRFQGCVGARLNSPALRSCSTHMHGDYLASLAVLVSVIGAKLGYHALDQIVAVLEAVHTVYISGRLLGTSVSGLMDSSAEPDLLEKLKRVVGETKSVTRVCQTTARWSGQRLLAQVDVEVPGDMAVPEADKLRAGIRDTVKRHVCRRSNTLVRISPEADGFADSPELPDRGRLE